MFARSPVILSMLVITILVGSSVGCSSLTLLPGSTSLDSNSSKSHVEQTAVVAQPASSCVVELRPHRGDVERRQVSIAEGMSVQDILTTIRAETIFSRMQVELKRPMGNSLQPLNMPVRYQRSQKRVNPAYNYAIRPGDCLVIKEDPSNALDDMLDKALTPLGISAGRRR